jgi:hypothetical protein
MLGSGRGRRGLASGGGVPGIIKEFYQGVASSHMRKIPTKTDLSRLFLQIVSNIQLRRRFEAPMDAACSGDGVLIGFLRSRGVVMLQGQDARSLVRHFLIKELQLKDTAALQNMTQP